MKLSPYSESGMERVSFDDGVRPRSARLSVFLARQSPAKNGLFFRLAGRKAEGSAPRLCQNPVWRASPNLLRHAAPSPCKG